MYREFKLPDETSGLAYLMPKAKKAVLDLSCAQTVTNASVTILDSIDGRLINAGFCLRWDRYTKRSGSLEIRDAKTFTRLISMTLSKAPTDGGGLPKTPLGDALRAALGERALIPLASRAGALEHGPILFKGAVIGDYNVFTSDDAPRPICLIDLRKGLSKSTRSAAMTPFANLPEGTFLSELMSEARDTASVNRKGFPALAPTKSSASAVALLHETLMKQFAAQIDGVKADLDIEFLHDMRVASRRARSLLQTVKNVLDPDTQRATIETFRWIGQQTTPLRDIDVYLHDFPELQSALSPDMAAALTAFETTLKKERRAALRRVKSMLATKRFMTFLQQWPEKLKSEEVFTGPDAALPIFELASKTIAKRYGRVCKDGAAIDDNAPAEALHDLRKEGKKLRYLLEFFASLYPAEMVKPRLTQLKKLQDLLGKYQDCAVQAAFLETYAGKLHGDPSTPPETLMAMGALADQRLQDEKRLRVEFNNFFVPFASAQERKAYKKMLSTPSQ